MLSSKQVDDFISRHRLPRKVCELVSQHYFPLCSWLIAQHTAGETQFVGINGAQGTGKSTLADFIRLALEKSAGWRVAVLSIDDFYLTRAERKRLGEKFHPLMETRGVPGTHDMQMLVSCVERLKKLGTKTKCALPRFDKSTDDRADPESWPVITGPVDLIILEGWCVGSKPQPEDALAEPINLLEQQEDTSGKWRRHVNRQLEGVYADLFARLDQLIVLQAPGFDAIYRWRLEQEEKLAAVTTHTASGIMDSDQLRRFIQYFERLTRANLAALCETADVVLELNQNHDCVSTRYASR